MTETSATDERLLDELPDWLRSLGSDSRSLLQLVEQPSVAQPVRRRAAAALAYLFKSLDLIPDGIEDLGYIDDACVLRVAAAQALAVAEGSLEGQVPEPEALQRLAEDTGSIRELLGESYEPLERYVEGLGDVVARGRSVDQILSDSATLEEFAGEVRAWADRYVAPSFARDPKNLVKLKSFFATKLAASGV